MPSDAPTRIPERCANPRTYLSLRRMGFPWWTCARIMWHGADLRVVEVGQ